MNQGQRRFYRLACVIISWAAVVIWARAAQEPARPAHARLAPAATSGAAPVTPSAAVDQVIFPPLVTATRTPTPINVGNLVWDDLDKDGRRDAGEPGLAGVSVQIWNDTKSQLLDVDVSDANGAYGLQVPGPGSYRVRAILPSVLDGFSPKDQAGGDDLLDSDINSTGPDYGFTDVYVFGSNLISITTIDIGIMVYRPPTPTRTPTPINVGNLVWYDINANGIQDAGEPGLSNIVVQLWNGDKSQLIDSATTNASGFYTLRAPTPGDYRVRVVPPTGAAFSPTNQGANDQADSDISTSFLNYGFTAVYSFASNLISISTIDAGLINVPATPTPTNTPAITNTPTGVAQAPEGSSYLPLVSR